MKKNRTLFLTPEELQFLIQYDKVMITRKNKEIKITTFLFNNDLSFCWEYDKDLDYNQIAYAIDPKLKTLKVYPLWSNKFMQYLSKKEYVCET